VGSAVPLAQPIHQPLDDASIFDIHFRRVSRSLTGVPLFIAVDSARVAYVPPSYRWYESTEG
jgi:hypothetical protein